MEIGYILPSLNGGTFLLHMNFDRDLKSCTTFYAPCKLSNIKLIFNQKYWVEGFTIIAPQRILLSTKNLQNL